MVEHVLVPFDGSDPSRSALRYASVLYPDSRLTVLNIIEPFPDHTKAGGHPSNRHERVYKQRKQLLDDAREATEHGGTMETNLIYGRPVNELPRYVATKGIDQVVMGSRGREGISNLMLGSISQAAIKRSPVPVTIVRASEKDGSSPKSVLVPFDGSARARGALRYAFEQFPDAEITALFVFASSKKAYLDIDSDTDLETAMDRDEDDSQTKDDQVLMTARRIAERYGRKITLSNVVGDPIHEIVRWTAEHDVDHLVIGRESSGGLTGFLLGDATESIVRRSRIPVTVVP